MSLLTGSPVRGGVWRASPELSWSSLVTRHRSWVAAAFAVCGLFGLGVTLVSSDHLHRMWGLMAACGYALAAVAVLAWRSHGADLALGLSLAGALIAPLAWMAVTGQGQPEVYVIIRSAELLVHHGTPYEAPSLLRHTHNPNAYNPYLPAMTFFALLWTVAPHNPLADPRIWFGVVFAGCFALALRVARAQDVARWTVFVTATTIIAFDLDVGGTAVPAVVVAVSLALARDGKRAAAVMTAVSLCTVAVLVGPFAIIQPESLVRNTISFPLGLASVTSAAVSPLPGHLIAETGHLGRLCVIAALVVTALA